MGRERRNWTAAEDAQLKKAVADIQSSHSQPLTWHPIAATLPGRTNKDCRKRWHYKVASNVNKGVWTASEDEKLCKAVGNHGTKWARVAAEMKTRNGDQCSKRWNDTMDPGIDHSLFTPEEDNFLIKGVDRFGHNWKTIAQTHFPRRTALAAKNRYSLLCRRMGGGNQRPNPEVAKQKRAKIPIATPSPLSNRGGSLSVCSNTSGVLDQFSSDEEVSGNDGEMSSGEDEDKGYSEDDSQMGNSPQLERFPSPADALNLKDLSNASGRLRGSLPQNPVGSSYDVLSARSTMAQINRSREEQSSQRHGIQSGQAMTCDYTYLDFSSDAFADFDALQQGFMQAATSATPSRQDSFVNGNTYASNMSNRNEPLMHQAPILHSRGTASVNAEMGYGAVVSPCRDSDAFLNQRPYMARSNASYQLLFPEPSQQASPELSQQASPGFPCKGPGQVTESDVAKQVTIKALCSGMQLGKLVQTVTDLASAVTVLIAEPPSS